MMIDQQRRLGHTDPAALMDRAESEEIRRLLKQARLVRSRRNGKQVCYTLADDHVKTILGMAREHLEE